MSKGESAVFHCDSSSETCQHIVQINENYSEPKLTRYVEEHVMHLIQTGHWHLLKPKTVIGLGLLDNITLGLGTFQLEGTENTSRSSHLSFLKTEDAAG